MLLSGQLLAWMTDADRDIKNGNVKNVDSNYILATEYTKNMSENVFPKYVRALKKSCEEDFQSSCVLLGKTYEKMKRNMDEGRTPPIDISAFIPKSISNKDIKKIYELACKKNESSGCFRLALMYSKEHDKKSIFYFNEAISKGYNTADGNAYLSLSLEYKKGDSVAKNIKKSYEILEQGCNKSKDAYLCLLVGIANSKGEEIRYNYKKAKNYLGKACDLGNGTGCYHYKDLLNP